MRSTRTMPVVCAVVSALLTACGASAPGATPRAAAAAAVAPGALAIYDDALASDWADWSWSSTRNFAATSPISSGTRSIVVSFQRYGGLYFGRSAGGVAGRSALQLAVNGGANTGARLVVRATVNRVAQGSADLATYCAGGAIPTNAWARCTIPLSALGPAGAAFDGFYVQENAGGSLNGVAFDEVALLPAPPAQPTGLVATASASGVSLSWAAVAGATGYTVQRATAAAGPYTALAANRAGTTYTDASAPTGATSWYQVVAVNAGGSGPASAAVGATMAAPPPPVASGLTVYGDALAAGWQDVSWDSARDLGATSPVASGGRSIAVTYQAWGALYLRQGTTLSGVTSLELSIDGGAGAGGKLIVAGVAGSTVTGQVELAPYCAGGTVPAGAWTRCKVPLAALSPAGTAIDGFFVQEGEGRARPAMYLDDVSFTAGTSAPALPPAPAGVSATAATGRVSVAWGAVAGATGYDVYRATASAGPFARLTASPQAGTTYADGAVTAGAAYWYQIRAVNAAGAGPASATVTATVPAAPPAQTVAVTVAPAAASVDGCTPVKLGATVTGTSDTSVTWAVQEGASAGTVDAAGNFTAGDYVGAVHVVATSKASPAATATATITVREHVLSLALLPGTTQVAPGAQSQFSAMVTTTCGTFAAQ